MPILDRQRDARLTELGRIRIGAKNNGRPSKLDTFRLTSRNHAALTVAASLYGGSVSQWLDAPAGTGRQYELVTRSVALDVALRVDTGLTQWYELWRGNSCQRRCDGVTEQLRQLPCPCPADLEERSEAATKGQACRPTSRLHVLLRDVPGAGLWRYETHGEMAAVELPASADLLRLAANADGWVAATLRLEQRVSGRKHYAVVVLDTPAVSLGTAVVGETAQTSTPATSGNGTTPDKAGTRGRIASAPVPELITSRRNLNATSAAVLTVEGSGEDQGATK